MKVLTKTNFLTTAKQVLAIEAKAIDNLISYLDDNFNCVCEVILNCTGKLIITGMGKSGHIAKKVAATMASTGTPAFFIHPADASHGDLGAINKEDIVLIFSNSGETDELTNIIPIIKKLADKIIAITSNPKSNLAKQADLSILLNITKEACPLNLAPTSSTTAALAIGDAIAVSLLQARGFNQHDFAKYHPNGRLGKRLLLTISDIMHVGNRIPIAKETTNLLEAVIEMSKKCFGLLIVVSANNPKKILGVLTDGDLRRIIDKRLDITKAKLIDIMNKNFKSIKANALVTEAIDIMEKNKILALPVVEEQTIVGIFNMHDIFRAGIL